MNATEELLLILADPACYPNRPGSVEIVQTHISIVSIAGELVYKFKKPVRLPFLDFSTIELRRHYCREEVRLNRRLCPDVYLGTTALARTADGPRLGTPGADDVTNTIDTAVVMRRLPADRMLDQLLVEGAVSAVEIAALARMVARFHAEAARGAAVRAAGAPERLLQSARENFTEIAALAVHGMSSELLRVMQQLTDDDFAWLLPVLHERADADRVIDGHGDLHTRNVCMTEPPAIYDCIEFSAVFRCGDVATDIAFLDMDLRYRGAPELATAFVDAYVAHSGDKDVLGLLPPLSRYRAMVRAKVAAMTASEAEIDCADRDGARSSAARHLQLAAASALESKLRRKQTPLWLLLCGPPGSGKSSLAARLRYGTNWPCLATDAIRKELAGKALNERLNASHYSAAFSERTYAELLRRAAAALRGGVPVVVLDGNFPTPDHRCTAAAAARAAGAEFVCLYVDVDEETGRTRVTTRAEDPHRISDAGPAQYDELRARFVAPSAAEHIAVHRLDATGALADVAAIGFARLLV